MKIENNIIKHHLRNVYFICGNACAGKTTMSKLISDKYGIYRYDFDDKENYKSHRAIADEKHQPHTCAHGVDFHKQWMRPIEEQAQSMMGSLREQNEMALIDLMKLSENQKVLADVLYSPDLTNEIIDYDHIVFLTVDRSLIRSSYFKRPDKVGFYNYVKSLEMADVYFENIFRSLELTNDIEQREMKQSGFLMLERTEDSTVEGTMKEIVRHFKF